MSIDNFWLAEREHNLEEEYFNEEDGLYYCLKCRTPVEAYLGAERGTEFAREQVYNVVNARWESGRPFIVTTNLTLQEMQNEEQMVLKRIYDRVLDVCRPVVFLGENFRANGRKNQLEMVQELWRDMQ